MIALATVHGSYLYGNPDRHSDLDLYIVNMGTEKKPTHSVSRGRDITEISYSTWMRQCSLGVPQALEAMFSTKTIVNNISHITSSFVPGLVDMRQTYYRTIKSFWLGGSEKQMTHAKRLAFNLETAMITGRFNPTLTDGEWAMIRATDLPDKYLL